MPTQTTLQQAFKVNINVTKILKETIEAIVRPSTMLVTWSPVPQGQRVELVRELIEEALRWTQHSTQDRPSRCPEDLEHLARRSGILGTFINQLQ